MSVFVGDIGTKIILDVGVDISSSTTKEIKYINPSGTLGRWTANIETTTSISYITQINDLNEAGRWKLQAYIETEDWGRHGEIAVLIIKPILGT